jgi:hypothetical protein
MMPGHIFGYDAKTTIGFQTRTDDIRIIWRKPLVGWCASRCATTT